MKKNRNTFFQESSYQSYNPNMAMAGGAPYQTASNYFYQGNDIESRIAKIERQLNRLDYRISKLENTGSTITNEEFETNNNTNMYML